MPESVQFAYKHGPRPTPQCPPNGTIVTITFPLVDGWVTQASWPRCVHCWCDLEGVGRVVSERVDHA